MTVRPALADVGIGKDGSKRTLIVDVEGNMLALVSGIIHKTRIKITVITHQQTLIEILFIHFPLSDSTGKRSLQTGGEEIAHAELRSNLCLAGILFRSHQLIIIIIRCKGDGHLETDMPATLVILSLRRCIGTEEGHAQLIAHITQGIGYSLQMTLHRSAQYLQAYLHHYGKRLEEKAERSIGMTEECCRTNTLISRLLRIINCQRVRIHHISIIRVKGIGSLTTPMQQLQLV